MRDHSQTFQAGHLLHFLRISCRSAKKRQHPQDAARQQKPCSGSGPGWGVFAVLGNHDAFGGHAHALDFVRSCGIRVLADEMLPLGPLTLLGIDDPDVRAQKGNKDADVAALTVGRPSDVPLVLLTHRPLLLPDSVGRFDLQLSGHTHGGRIGLVEPLLKRAYGTPTGLSRHTSPAGESLLYVTTGVGFSKLPIRLGAPPEIVVIDLVTSAAGGRP